VPTQEIIQNQNVKRFAEAGGRGNKISLTMFARQLFPSPMVK
jgi:hypothetical protein